MMGGHRVALVVSDVDGTLLTTGKVLTARNRAAVLRLAEHGTPLSGARPGGQRLERRA